MERPASTSRPRLVGRPCPSPAAPRPDPRFRPFGRIARDRRDRRDRRGQSLTEFALALPVVLLLILFGLDFGRIFLGWVQLTNAAREASNFAAMNPDAWGSEPSASIQSEYARLVTAETSNANCTLGSINAPTFPSGTSIGSPASVSISCTFHLITPVIGNIVGNLISVTASSAFPVRSGIIDGIPVATASPTASPGSSSPGASASFVIVATPTPIGATPTPSASATSTPLASPTPTATPMCLVPNMKNVNTASAPSMWTAAGFTAANLLFSPLVGPGNNYSIKDQSLTQGTSVACTSSMVVYDKVHH